MARSSRQRRLLRSRARASACCFASAGRWSSREQRVAGRTRHQVGRDAVQPAIQRDRPGLCQIGPLGQRQLRLSGFPQVACDSQAGSGAAPGVAGSRGFAESGGLSVVAPVLQILPSRERPAARDSKGAGSRAADRRGRSRRSQGWARLLLRRRRRLKRRIAGFRLRRPVQPPPPHAERPWR